MDRIIAGRFNAAPAQGPGLFQGKPSRATPGLSNSQPVAVFQNSPLPCRLFECGVGPVLMDVITQSLVQHLLLALPQIEF